MTPAPRRASRTPGPCSAHSTLSYTHTESPPSPWPAQCLACPTGYVAQPGSTRCTACLPGSYYGQEWSFDPYKCLPCPEGELGAGYAWQARSQRGTPRVSACLRYRLATRGPAGAQYGGLPAKLAANARATWRIMVSSRPSAALDPPLCELRRS